MHRVISLQAEDVRQRLSSKTEFLLPISTRSIHGEHHELTETAAKHVSASAESFSSLLRGLLCGQRPFREHNFGTISKRFHRTGGLPGAKSNAERLRISTKSVEKKKSVTVARTDTKIIWMHQAYVSTNFQQRFFSNTYYQGKRNAGKPDWKINGRTGRHHKPTF